MVSLPPSGMASRALTTRFISTCSIWPGSAWTSAEVRREHLDEVDVLAEDPPEHLLDPGGDLVQVQRHGLQHLLAAEGQELPGQRRRALAGLLHLQQIVLERVALAHAVQREPGVAQDHGEQVVEVVRHAAREAADGLHLLRRPELLLELLALRLRPLALGDVPEVPHPAKVFLVWTEHRRRVAVERPAVLELDLVLGGLLVGTSRRGASPW